MSSERAPEWDQVKGWMEASPVRLGPQLSGWLRDDPFPLLHHTSRYKFAAKMIGRSKRVLDVACGEGFGTWLLAVECGHALGIDEDAAAIERASANWRDPKVRFIRAEREAAPEEPWDAVVCLDVERAAAGAVERFVAWAAETAGPRGIVVLGGAGRTPAPQLRAQFKFVFSFSCDDEVVRLGAAPQADYHLAVACGQRIRP